jgi:calcineurin-like phosphoesterase family protein
MNEMILAGINDNVGEDDILFFLGDWSFGGFDNISKFRELINVRTIHFIIGNHDHHVENNKNDVTSEFDLVTHYLPMKVDKQLIILSHYPILAWQESYHGSWLVHGHTHGILPTKDTLQWAGDNIFIKTGKMLDVGMDSAKELLGEYRPFSYEEVKEYMRHRTYEFVEYDPAFKH